MSTTALTGGYRPRPKNANAGNSVMRQKLTDVGFKKSPVRQNSLPRLPAITVREKDGSDHINIWLRANTQLGVSLNHMERCPIVHPVFKSFNSIEGLWHWLRDKDHDDRHRNSFGLSAKINAKNDITAFVPNFKHIICEANWIKVKNSEWFVTELKASTLPFDMYYYDRGDSPSTGVAVRPPSALWLVACFEEIRKAVKEDREPDFSFLGPKQEFDLSDFIKTSPIKPTQDKSAFKPKKEHSARFETDPKKPEQNVRDQTTVITPIVETENVTTSCTNLTDLPAGDGNEVTMQPEQEPEQALQQENFDSAQG